MQIVFACIPDFVWASAGVHGGFRVGVADCMIHSMSAASLWRLADAVFSHLIASHPIPLLGCSAVQEMLYSVHIHTRTGHPSEQEKKIIR